MNTQTPSPLRTRGLRVTWALCLLALTAPMATWASTPIEKVVCTQAPRSQWLSETQARTAFNANAYVLVRFKISRGNCHEFYAIDAQGGIVEAYQHPVTGESLRTTRIAPTQASNPSLHAQR
jgi:hypothetical protein